MGNQAHRRQAGWGAIALSILAVLLWLPVMNYLANPGLPALLALVFLVATVLAARGRRRARIVAAAAGGLLLLVMAPYWIHGFNDEDNQYGAEYAVMDMVAAALCVLGVVLLHRQDNHAEGHTTDPNQT